MLINVQWKLQMGEDKHSQKLVIYNFKAKKKKIKNTIANSCYPCYNIQAIQTFKTNLQKD